MDGRVSILIVTQNTKELLCRTLDSIWKQTYTELEVIIIDDCSIDGTLEIVQALYGERENLYYIYNDSQLGVSASYNEGARTATGRWLTIAECGTVWHPERLQRQIAVQRPDSWSYCRVLAGNRTFPRDDWEEYKRKGKLMPTLLLEDQVNLQGVLMETQAFLDLGGFDENLAERQEYDLLLRLSESYMACEIPEVLVTVVYKSSNPDIYVVSEVYLLDKYAEVLGRLGLKKDVLTQVLDHAGILGKMAVFWEYVNYLLGDEEYAGAIAEYVRKHNLVRYLEPCDGDTIHGVQHCTGCMVCAEICPVGAIHIQEDQGGFLVPVIEAERCIHCGKCKEHCPTQRDLLGDFRKQICYAVQAKESIRIEASSGGVFPLLAEYILSQGGYVVGAVYNSDFSVKHIVSNRQSEIRQMYGSKYVQSDLRGIYAQVRERLKEGTLVLFSGVACQIAGLRAYLEGDCDDRQLYTVDVVCHGVPSPGAWRRRVQELEAAGELDKISFRDKKSMGWGTGLYVTYKDGKKVVALHDSYMSGFLNNWILRDSCYNCNFKAEAYSDLTLGDFWGIRDIDDSFDEWGTSYITLNSRKGEQLWQGIKSALVLYKTFPVSLAVQQNKHIECPVRDNELHRQIQKLWKAGDWQSAQKQIYKKLHFDVAMVALLGQNYGNAITNYALYHVLQTEKRTLMIDTGVYQAQGKFEDFIRRHFLLSSDYYGRREWDDIQESCNTFVVGSDQVWNSKFTEESHWGTFFQLDFVNDDKKKISYASSFGQSGLEPRTEETKRLYQRFQYLSVREAFGVEACRKLYQMDAEQVVDPVFLLQDKEYEDLIRQWNPQKPDEEEEPFIVAYLLSPTVEKRKFCEKLQAQLNGMKLIYMIDNAMEVRDWARHVLNFENVKVDLDVEEWLYYLHKAKYVVTDSFHGTCFSIIFHKPFLSIVNRQTDRFQFFGKLPGIEEHILQSAEEAIVEKIFEKINYEAVDEKLNQERDRSKKWLDNALSNESMSCLKR